MAERTILAVPGIDRTSGAFRSALWEMAARHSWDVDAIATVISSESGFNAAAKNPYGSASGLIQFTDPTAHSLGTSSAELRGMTDVQQLPYVERFYQRAGLTSQSRPFDFYVVGLGKPRGLSLDTQVVSDAHYEVNKGLDVDGDGRITVSDMAAVFGHTQARAGGRRVAADPLEKPPSWDSFSPRSDSLLYSRSDGSNLSALEFGAFGPDVAFVQQLLGVKSDGMFGRITEKAVVDYQITAGLKVDGIIGPYTWGHLWEGLHHGKKA